jgi:2,4-dienoyl-CoA reductase-like NADH-dependent reductase (Old Yellow Enzyme family)
MIVVGASVVDPDSWERQGLLPLFDAAITREWAPVVDAVHSHGALLVSQQLHFGAELKPGLFRPLWSPSGVANSWGTVPHELDLASIGGLRSSYLRAAENVIASGFDGIELNAAHSFLLDQFLSPSTNRREDAYGGDLQGRSRLLVELLSELRERHPEAILGARLPFQAEPEHDELAVAALLDAGRLVDYVVVTLAAPPWRFMRDSSFPPAGLRGAAAALKRRVTCKVVLSQHVDTPDLAEDVLATGDADLVGLARPLIADPSWAAKARRGEQLNIRPCVRTIACRGGGQLSCDVNPSAFALPAERNVSRYARRFPFGRRRMVIVGGGPAGCEAALGAAGRGASVVLFEREEHLGGRARLAGRAPFRAVWTKYADYLERTLGREAAVELRLGTTATAELVEAEEPDIVVVAAGAQMRVAVHPGRTPVSADDLLACPDRARDWRRVLVADETGGWEAVNAVELLVELDKEVSYVTARERLADQIVEDSRDDIAERLRAARVAIYTAAALEHGSIVERLTNRSTPLDVDALVWAGQLVSVAGVGLPGAVASVTIGDALSPRGLRIATAEGASVASLLEGGSE